MPTKSKEFLLKRENVSMLIFSDVTKEDVKIQHFFSFPLFTFKVPQKDAGFRRGKSLGSVGLLHEPETHNMLINPDPESQFVTAEDANAYKNWQNG